MTSSAGLRLLHQTQQWSPLRLRMGCRHSAGTPSELWFCSQNQLQPEVEPQPSQT